MDFLVLLAAALAAYFSYITVRTMIGGGVYVPSRGYLVDDMIKITEPKKGMRMADLGAGDGRVVIGFAKAGVEAHGYEINPILVVIGRYRIRRAGVQGQAFMHWQNFWKVDLGQFDIVTVFLYYYIFKDLEKKLRRELKPGAKITTSTFAFPDWPILKQEHVIFLYEK